MFTYIFLGNKWDLSLSSLRHKTTRRRTNTSKTKKFNFTWREKGCEAVKTINFSLRPLKMFNCAIFQSQWDLPIML